MVAGRRVGHRETARIRAYLEDTTNPLGIGQIAEIMGVSRRTIERLRLNFELFDAPYPPTTVKLGRPPTLTEEQQGVCKHADMLYCPEFLASCRLTNPNAATCSSSSNSSRRSLMQSSKTPLLLYGNGMM